MIFKDRVGTNLNRKRIKIISQTPTEIIADVERADTITEEGTQINASIFNTFQTDINTANNNASQALSLANNAITEASKAVSDSTYAKNKANEVANSFSELTTSSEILNVSYSTSKADWAHSDVNALDTLFGISGNSDANHNVKFFGQDSSKVNVVIDGDFYGNNGQNKAAYENSSPSFSKINVTTGVLNSESSNNNHQIVLGKTDVDHMDFKEYSGKFNFVETSGGTTIASIKSDGIYTNGVKLSTLNEIYPIGTIYMSVSSTTPASLFGGSWSQLENRFLLGAGSSYTNGATGGSATHTLTASEMPSHNHKGLYWQSSSYGTSLDQGSDKIWLQHNWYGSSNFTDFYTGYTGSTQAHNNMPPYLVVYMWKRIA